MGVRNHSKARNRLMTRLLSGVLVCILLFSASGTSALAANGTKNATSRAIAIVFDNSGSMYTKQNKAWCRATYAIEVFASMMNQGDTLQVYNHQLAEHHVPVLEPGVPVLHDALGCQVEHPAQRIIIGKGWFVLCYLPELAVLALDDVCRVYDFLNFHGAFKERCLKIFSFPPSFLRRRGAACARSPQRTAGVSWSPPA